MKVKTEIKAKAKVFSISTLTSTCILILTLILFVLPEDVEAQVFGREKGVKKYSLWGDITLQYEDGSGKSGGQTTHKNMFTQNYNLNFKSYIISPKLMYYTINTGFDMRTGTMYHKGTAKSYGIETVFFRNQPFNFSLRASRNDGYDYETTNYGLSMSYTRKVRRIRPIRPAAPPEEDVNKNLNRNANLNNNANLNANTNEEGNTNANMNIVPEAKPKLKRKPPSSNLFYDIINILPISISLDGDRNTSAFSGGPKSSWDIANLRASGIFRMTTYSWDLEYSNWKSDYSEHKGYGGGLETNTNLNWTFFRKFENYIYYRKNDVTSYSINSSLTGVRKKWSYGIYATYSLASNSESARQYNIRADAGNVSPYIYKGVNLSYGMGIGYQKWVDKNELSANGRLYATKRFGLNTNLFSSLNITGSNLGTAFNFLTGISYTFRPRKGYVVSIEFDPQGNTLKTRAFKPQVYGWDYSIRTGYTFGISRDTRKIQPVYTVTGPATTNKTLTSHRGDLNINVYLRLLTISSDAYFYYTDAGKRLEWNNSIYATVMRKIGITIGTGLTVDMPEGGTKTTNYNIYNLITYRLWRTALLRLDSRYTKTMPADTATLEITPSIAWRWRSVFVDLEVRLKTDKTGNGAETKERRIMLRVTRPFKIL